MLIFKKLLFLILIFFSLQVFAITYQENKVLEFNANADFFHLMDQVTESTPPFFADPTYKEAWKEKFDISAKDQLLFEKYKLIRNKYQKFPKAYRTLHGTAQTRDGLFSPDPASVYDPILDAFYTSQNLEEALAKLSGIVSAEDVDFLRDFFQHFFASYQTLTNLHPQKTEWVVNHLNELWQSPGVQAHLTNMIHFYHASNHPFKSVLLFWCPAKAGMSGASLGDHLWLAIPIDTVNINNEELRHFLVSVLVHEATHHISGEAPLTQKQALTKRFLRTVKSLPSDQDYIVPLEEPLVMASQMLFFKTYYPNYYNPDAPWFNNPYAKGYEKVLASYYQGGKSVDDTFIDACAEIYTTTKSI